MIIKIEAAIIRYLNTKSFSQRITEAVINKARLIDYMAKDIMMTLRTTLPRVTTEAMQKVNNVVREYLNRPTVIDRVDAAIINRVKATKYLSDELQRGIRDGLRDRM